MEYKSILINFELRYSPYYEIILKYSKSSWCRVVKNMERLSRRRGHKIELWHYKAKLVVDIQSIPNLEMLVLLHSCPQRKFCRSSNAPSIGALSRARNCSRFRMQLLSCVKLNTGTKATMAKIIWFLVKINSNVRTQTARAGCALRLD